MLFQVTVTILSYTLTIHLPPSVLNDEQVKHFRLQEAQGKYCIFQQEFDSIEQLIEYYTTHELGANGFKLTFPLQIVSSDGSFLFFFIHFPHLKKQPPETADVSLIGSITSFQVEDNQLQFVRIIGRGNFSEVWEGTLDGLPVAIKTFKNRN